MAISSISNQNLYRNYQSLASGKRVNKAADDAAALAIVQKLLSQKNGHDVAYRNAGTSQDMLKVADGAMGSVTDSLQRIRELSVQASNFMYTASDRGAIQAEIDQLKQSISDTASQTQFNKMNVLDGSMSNSHVAANPDGSGMRIGMANSTLEALGIADFDVTKGNFSLDDIDNAMEMVSSQRGNLGASTNRLEHTYNNNTSATLNQLSSRSRIEDLDMPKAISDKKKEELLGEYRNLMLKKRMQQDSMVLKLFQ